MVLIEKERAYISSVIAWMPMPNAYEPPNNMIGD